MITFHVFFHFLRLFAAPYMWTVLKKNILKWANWIAFYKAHGIARIWGLWEWAASVIMQIHISNKVSALEEFVFLPSLLSGLMHTCWYVEKSCQHHIIGDVDEFFPPWNVIRGRRAIIQLVVPGGVWSPRMEIPSTARYRQSCVTEHPSWQYYYPRSWCSSYLFLGWVRTSSFGWLAKCFMQVGNK